MSNDRLLPPAEAQDLLHARGWTAQGDDTAFARAVDVLGTCDEAEALTIIAIASSMEDVVRAVDQPMRWPECFNDSLARWAQYVTHVESQLRGDAEVLTETFGSCNRCGSRRLIVTTRQLQKERLRLHATQRAVPTALSTPSRRRHDGVRRSFFQREECAPLGMRTCRECGHTTRINS